MHDKVALWIEEGMDDVPPAEPFLSLVHVIMRRVDDETVALHVYAEGEPWPGVEAKSAESIVKMPYKSLADIAANAPRLAECAKDLLGDIRRGLARWDMDLSLIDAMEKKLGDVVAGKALRLYI